jgi:hypothetical protein
MATGTTIPGATGTITIPFASGANETAAQAALNNVNKFIASGATQVVNIPGGIGALPTPDPNFTNAVGVLVQDVVGATVEGVVPVGYSTILNANIGLTVLLGAQDTKVVESGANSTLLYGNTAQNAQVFLGGGINYIFNAWDPGSMTVNLNGPSVAGGSGAAIIDGAHGSTTVNLFDGSLINVLQGNVSVVANTGIETVEVSAPDAASTTSAVTVSGVTGSTIYYIPGGGKAFLTPGAGNIVVFDAGLGGSETLFGGSAVFGGNTLTANAFTGSATVVGGNGYFQGGSAGNNVLLTSTVAGAATLVGGGSGDQLSGFGAGDLIIAGTGNETLLGLSATGGQTFVLGNTGAQDFFIGDVNGNDTIKLGSGSATIGLQHATSVISSAFTSITSGNTIMEQPSIGGGNITITNFIPSAVGFGTLDVVSLNAGVTVNLLQTVGSSNTLATLSDGTTITFVGVSGAQITNHGSFLT